MSVSTPGRYDEPKYAFSGVSKRSRKLKLSSEQQKVPGTASERRGFDVLL